jgi:transaldolase
MIKIPATAAGLPAITALIAEGINVNVTLIFGLRRYGEVVEAFLAGLERRVAQRLPVEGVASVASFFLSRIDTAIDAEIDAQSTSASRALRGLAATASAKLAYGMYKEWRAGDRWRSILARGARPQRLLWASTSTKDPAYNDLKYVEDLIGPETVNTLVESDRADRLTVTIGHEHRHANRHSPRHAPTVDDPDNRELGRPAHGVTGTTVMIGGGGHGRWQSARLCSASAQHRARAALSRFGIRRQRAPHTLSTFHSQHARHAS